MFQKTSNKAEAAALNVNASQNKKNVPTVLSCDLHILGNLSSEGMVDVDGSIEGNVKAEHVSIRTNGKVIGDVVAEQVHVYGTVRGLIRAHAVHLYASCHVEGVIIHQSLSVEDGAFVDGKFKRAQGQSLDTRMEEDSGSSEEGIIDIPPATSGNLRLIG